MIILSLTIIIIIIKTYFANKKIISYNYAEDQIIYSESQINEYIARAHKMSSSKFILKCMTAVMLPHWSAQKESCLDVRSFKGLNTIYENISKYHCS